MTDLLLLAGVSTRAMAASAIRAGHSVCAIESFHDLDHPALPQVMALEQGPLHRFSARRAALASRDFPATAVSYSASFENDPEAVRVLSAGRRLWGNAPQVLQQVRNPFQLERALREGGFATARVRASTTAGAGRDAWLLKPRRSGGGQRISQWSGRRVVPRWGYLQERIEGIPGSLLFVANGRDAVPVALTRQLIGDRRFGASGFRYTGNLISSERVALFPREREVLAAATSVARWLAARFGLVGVNGIDFMARGGMPIVTEVNPRWTGAAELAERAYGMPLFRWHREGCGGQLPDFSLDQARQGGGVWAKALSYARTDLQVGNSVAAVGHEWVADVPNPGERIATGQPVCTLFARGVDRADTIRALLAAQQRFLRLARSTTARVA